MDLSGFHSLSCVSGSEGFKDRLVLLKQSLRIVYGIAEGLDGMIYDEIVLFKRVFQLTVPGSVINDGIKASGEFLQFGDIACGGIKRYEAKGLHHKFELIYGDPFDGPADSLRVFRIQVPLEGNARKLQ